MYVTGRTSGAERSQRSERSETDRPETIEETAALVDEAGGHGIPVQVDHLVSSQVSALMARIRTEQGALHVLVNDIWGAEIEWGEDGLGILPGHRTAHAAHGRRQPCDHQPLRAAPSSRHRAA